MNLSEAAAALGNGRSSSVDPTPSDDHSAATLPTGSGTDPIDIDFKELTLRFEFTPKSVDASTKVAQRHMQLLHAMTQAFADEIVIFSNKGKKAKINQSTMMSLTYHQQNWKIHKCEGSQKRKAKFVIVHRIRTTVSLSTIKNFHSVFDLLQASDCFLRKHEWPESTWDLVQNAYCVTHHPQCLTI